MAGTDSGLTFLEDRQEWNGTKIIFEMIPHDGKTEIKLTHQGLTQQIECYNACSPAWIQYMRFSLLPLINEGIGHPGFPPNEPRK